MPLALPPAAEDLLFRVEVPFGPRWQHVEMLRLSILHCVTTVFHSHDFCERLGMVTAELLENAIHYGDWTAGDPRPFRLAVRGTDRSVIVEVENPVTRDRGDAVRLTELVSRIASAPSVRELYVARLRDIAEAPDRAGSGLGLLRIAHETGCRLDAREHDATARVVATIQRVACE